MGQARIKQIKGLQTVLDSITGIDTITETFSTSIPSGLTGIVITLSSRETDNTKIYINGQLVDEDVYSWYKDGVLLESETLDAGSELFWDSTKAGFELEESDRIEIIYETVGSGNNLESISADRGVVTNHIIPDANETYDLGSPDKNFRDLYLSGNTLYMGGQPLSIVNGQLVLNGAPVTGTPTASGTSGTSGTSGLNGLIGAKGANGKNGAVGPQGIQGIKGDTGIDGTSGISGTSGTSGVDGAKGDQGIPAPSSPITAKWKWSNATTPTSGKVTTSSGSMHAPTITGITFHDIDSDGINRDATLNAVGPGSIIMLSTFGSPYAGTSEWTVTSVFVSGSYVTFNVTNNTSNGAVQPPIDHLVYAEMSVIPQTIPGPQGIPGFNGEKGAPGSRGSKGDSGDAGAQGLAGNDGTSGTSGIDGPKVGTNVPDLGVGSYFGQLGYLSDGTVYQWDGGLWKQVLDLNGANGAAGQSGTSGVDGVTGQSGTSGTSGVDGAAGQSGTSGSSGIDGAAGQSGTSGTSGIDGAKGATGAQGPAGTGGGSTISNQICLPYAATWTLKFNNSLNSTVSINKSTINSLILPSNWELDLKYLFKTSNNSYQIENTLNIINPNMKYRVGSLRGIGNAQAGISSIVGPTTRSLNEILLYAIKNVGGSYKPILLDYINPTTVTDFYTLESTNNQSLIDLTDCVAIGLMYVYNANLGSSPILSNDQGHTTTLFTYELT